MDLKTQAGTDSVDPKEQARLNYLRAQRIAAGTEADEDEETVVDEVVEAVEEAVEDAVEEEDEALEADDSEAADDDESETDEDEDGEGEETETVAPTAADGKQKKRKQNKLAKAKAEIERLKTQIEDGSKDLDARVEEALARSRQAEAELAQVRSEQQRDAERVKQVRQHVGRLRGTDDELNRLTRFIAASDDANPLDLTQEQREQIRGAKARLNQIIAARDVYDLASEAADADLRERVGSILQSFAKLPGVDRDFADRLTFKPALQHLYDAGYTQGRDEQAKEMARLTKQVANLEGKLSEAKTKQAAPLKRVAPGGSPVGPATKPKPRDQMSPTERAAEMGMFLPDGRLNPEFKQKVRSGLLSLAS